MVSKWQEHIPGFIFLIALNTSATSRAWLTPTYGTKRKSNLIGVNIMNIFYVVCMTYLTYYMMKLEFWRGGQVLKIEDRFSWRSRFLSWSEVEKYEITPRSLGLEFEYNQVRARCSQNLKSYGTNYLDVNYKLPSWADNPFVFSYIPELYVTPVL